MGKVDEKKTNSSKDEPTNWSVRRVVAARLEVPEWVSENVVDLLDQGCTIPFIARYRKEQTGGMEVQKLRDVCHLVEELRGMQSKIRSVKATIESMGKLTEALDKALKNAQSVTEVEDLFAPYKPGNKGSLAERARALGLEPLAIQFLHGEKNVSLNEYIDKDEKGLSSKEKVVDGVKHIIADIIHKDTETMEKIRELCNDGSILVESIENTSKRKKELKPGEKDPETMRHKFENYFKKTIPVRYLKPHQVLALNRGEEMKILTVKVTIGSQIKSSLLGFCHKKWLKRHMDEKADSMIRQSLEDAFDRLILPQMCRLVRSRLTKEAQKASIEVFASNLKCLLLTPPLRDKTILALDPGFTNGCKSAVVSPTGQILHTEIIYMHDRRSNKYHERCKLLKIIAKYRCEVFAIGNGVACRETESYISSVIQSDYPDLKYCIIDECGASIYSASKLAEKEMPKMDVSLRGAVSIGRRLLDPLAELVKIEPKHLGVGQYQHDMPQNQLKTSLDSTVEECVSFVGVNINTSSECLLSRIAGLSETKAKKIVEWRETSGPFICREQMLNVKGLGEKSYEQAAGFIRVHAVHTSPGKEEVKEEIKPEVKTEADSGDVKPGKKRKLPAKTTTKAKKKKKTEDFKSNPLDMTWIHPESYPVVDKLLAMMGLQVEDLGKPQFITKVQAFLGSNSLSELAAAIDCGEPTLKLITDAFLKPLSYDLREEFQKPLFRSAVSSIDNLKSGATLTGIVRNVTHFGAFVDIGVGIDGLIHISNMRRACMKGKDMLEVGDKVEVSVQNVDVFKKRIGLKLCKLL